MLLSMDETISDKSRGVVLGLAACLGVLGVHRFYVGKIGTGVLMFLTGGGAAIWWIIDLVRISTGEFRDADGHRVLDWSVDLSGEARGTVPELEAEIDALNDELDEVGDRIERAERELEAESVARRD